MAAAIRALEEAQRLLERVARVAAIAEHQRDKDHKVGSSKMVKSVGKAAAKAASAAIEGRIGYKFSDPALLAMAGLLRAMDGASFNTGTPIDSRWLTTARP